jgi:hypothetical protein
MKKIGKFLFATLIGSAIMITSCEEGDMADETNDSDSITPEYALIDSKL